MAGFVTKVLASFNKNPSLVNWLERMSLLEKAEEKETALSPAEKVFGIQLLLDKILHFAIFDENGKVVRKTANSCKLVQNAWLERVCAALKKMQPPGYTVTLHHSGNGDKLRKFVKSFANSPAHRIPPFRLIIRPTDYSKHRTRIVNCLTHCGSGILDMKLYVLFISSTWEKNHHEGPPLLPLLTTPLHLPQLKSVIILIDFESMFRLDSCYDNLYKNAKLLIDSVLAGCECLQEFTVSTKWGNPQLLSDIFSKNFQLPSTVTTVNLKFTCKVSHNLLGEMMLENPFPNLTSLTLCARFSQDDLDYQVPRLLNKFRHQLQKLKIDVIEYDHNTAVVLPLMERLDELECSAWKIQWPAPGSGSSLVGYFPALKKICLYSVVKWPQDVQLQAVEHVTLVKVPEPTGAYDDAKLLHQMQQLKQATPNITTLFVTFQFTEQMSHVKFIFREMRQLQHLGIFLFETFNNGRNREFDEIFGVCREVQNYTPPLLNMTELRTFWLKLGDTPCFDMDTAIGLTFMKLPQLQHLTLEGNIKVSQEVVKRWRDQGPLGLDRRIKTYFSYEASSSPFIFSGNK